MGVERFPVYRLIDGRVMLQARHGDRWSFVNDAVVVEMFKTFDGKSLDVVAIGSARPAADQGSGQPPVHGRAPNEAR